MTTIQDVAREAGMSPGNLYRYFASKDAIVAGYRHGARVVTSAAIIMISLFVLLWQPVVLASGA